MNTPHFSHPGKPRLLDQVRETIRVKHYSPKTERAYVGWVRRYIIFHGKRHPAEMGADHVAQFLSHLALEARVAASTQNQAFNALLFLYRQVLHIDLGQIAGAVRAKRPKRLPVVLTREEVDLVLSLLEGEVWLVCSLLYGAGLRLFEALQLRVKDIDFSRSELLLRDGKGQKDRVTMLPTKVQPALRQHLEMVRRQHDWDLAQGLGHAPLARGAGSQVSQRGPRVGLAVGLPRCHALHRSAYGGSSPFSLARDGGAEGRPRGGPQGRHSQTRHATRLSPQFRHPFTPGQLRHPDGARTAWPQGREYDDDLHPRAEPGRSRRPEPPGSALTAPVGLCQGDDRHSRCATSWPHDFSCPMMQRVTP